MNGIKHAHTSPQCNTHGEKTNHSSTQHTPPPLPYLNENDPFHIYIADRFTRSLNPDNATIHLTDEFAYMKTQYTKANGRVAPYMKKWFFGKGHSATDNGQRLVVLDPNCSHCKTLLATLDKTKGTPTDYRLQGIHIYTTTPNDGMTWSVGDTCPFPHCFEYTCNPPWITPYTTPNPIH